MRFSHLAAVAAASLLASAPLHAQSSDQGKQSGPDKPVMQQDTSVRDVAMTPISDLGIKKDEIPALLIRAQQTRTFTAAPARRAAVITATPSRRPYRAKSAKRGKP